MNMRNSGGTAVNTFGGGMVSDIDPILAKSNTYYYAENASTNNHGNSESLSNLKSIDDKFIFSDNPGVFMASTETSGYAYIVSKYSLSLTEAELYVFRCSYLPDNNISCVKVATIKNTINNSSISSIDHISLTASIESDKIHRLYFADGINGIYSINCYREPGTNMNIDYEISLIENNSKSYITPTVLISKNSSGNLTTGKYFYVIKYLSDSGVETSEVFVSMGINAVDTEAGGIIDSETGMPSTTNTGVDIEVGNIDTNAYGINVYRIVYRGSGINSEAQLIYSRMLDKVNPSYVIYVHDVDNSNVLNDVSNSIQFNDSVKIASVLENKDSILLAGNIEYKKNANIDYDVRAFAFDHNGEFKYRNMSDKSGENTRKLRLNAVTGDLLPNVYTLDNDVVGALQTLNREDFINDSIYKSERYRDIENRYNLVTKYINGRDQFVKTYGGKGPNVTYEFIHSYLIGVEPPSVFTNNKNDSTWFNYDKIYNDSNATESDTDEDKALRVMHINMMRDNLVINYGDTYRDIKNLTIKHQSTYGNDTTENISINKFGISDHTGKFDYSNSIIANTLSSFKRNEIYRFAVRFKTIDGSETDPMWISDIRFPANYITNTNGDDIFTFSSFVDPLDTDFGAALTSNMLNKNTASKIVMDGFKAAEAQDVILKNSAEAMGSNEIGTAELLVKPLGLKFKFNNVPDGVVSAKILYTPIDLTERTIIGQFLVSRIGMFSSGNSEYNEFNRYNESSSNGISFPHPSPSMKYSYGIGHMGVTYNRGFGYTNPSDEIAYHNTAGLGSATARMLSYDSYTSAASPTVGGVPDSYITNSKNQKNRTSVTDHRESNSNAISMSPYYSDIRNYSFISPEISYYGESYVDVLKNMSSSVVFENLIYSKNTIPVLNKNYNSLVGKDLSLMPIIGTDDMYSNPNEMVPAQTTANQYGVINSAISGNITDLGWPWNNTSPSGANSLVYTYGTLFAIPYKFIYSYMPIFMYSGAMLDKSERILSESDKMIVTISACGPTVYGLLEALFHFKTGKNEIVSNRDFHRFGDFPIFITKYTDTDTQSHSEKRFMFANRFRTNNAFNDSNVDSPNGVLNYDGYNNLGQIQNNVMTEFFIDILGTTDSWANSERMWDCHNYIDDQSGVDKYIGEAKDLPISIKTFMSGVGYRAQRFLNNGDDYFILANATSGYDTSRILLDKSLQYESFKVRIGDQRGIRVKSANSTTFKYFKTTIPNSKYNPNDISYNILNNSKFNKYISFFTQNSKKFSDYRYSLSDKNGDAYAYRSYNPINDESTFVGKSKNGVLHESGVWDLAPIKISRMFFSGVMKSPTGSFDMTDIHKLSGESSSYINYSKTLSNDLAGATSEYGGRTNSFFSSKTNPSWKPTTTDAFDSDGSIVDPTFTTMNAIRRGKISGKHGACAIVSTDLSIPMIGHIMMFDDRLNKVVDNIIDGSKGTAIDNNLADNTKLAWNILDGACSSHTSTYIVDIRSRSSFLYNTASSLNKANSKYIESAQTINLSTNSRCLEYYVFGGDVYIGMFDYTATYPNKPEPDSSYNNDLTDRKNWNTLSNSSQVTRINLLVPIESFVNTHADCGNISHRSSSMWKLEMPYTSESSPNAGYSSSPLIVISNEYEYQYADAYSAKKKFNQVQVNTSEDDKFNDYKYKARIIASEKKIIGEQVDNWAVFKPQRYIDLNPTDGAINSISGFSNRVYALQDDAVSYLSINERAVIDNGSDSGQLLLGTGGVLEYSRAISNIYGLQKESMSAIHKGQSGIYFFDSKRMAICKIGEGIDNLSSITGTKTISESIGQTTPSNSFIYPYFNTNSVFMTFGNIDYIGENNNTLMYNEKSRVFDSFIKTKPNIETGLSDSIKFGFGLNGSVFFIVVHDNEYKIASFGNKMSDMSVYTTVNQDASITKIFDSIDINASDSHQHTANGRTRVYSKYSNSVSSTGAFSEITSLSNQNKNSDIHAAVGRVSGTITRMRDKYMKSMYKFIGNNKISIPYIKTNYKFSAI